MSNELMNADALTGEDKKVLKDAVLELSDSLMRASSERETQKAIIDETSDKIGVDKRLLRRLAKAHFKANYDQEVEGNHTFEEFFDAIMK